jgi:DNA-binding CsgD family transcriptional regulator/tetratricopeptide (TPR) repeat protein
VGRLRELEDAGAVLQPKGPRSVVVFGDAGVGKSRLLDELTRTAVSSGWVVERIYGSPSVRGLTLGAVAHLLPARPIPDESAPLRLARAELLRRRRDRRLLMVVDDVHQLDEGTLALLHQLLAHDEAHIAAASRVESDRAEAVAPLWVGSYGRRLELEPLDRSSSDELARSTLGGAVDGRLAAAVWELAQGVPLWTAVALDAAVVAGDVTEIDHRWQLVGTLASAHLDDLVWTRLQLVSPRARDALALLAHLEPMPDAISDLVDRDVLEELRAGGVISRRVDDGVANLITAHPLFSDVMSRRESEARRRRLLRAFVERLRDHPERSTVDPVRLAVWELEAGARPAAELAERASTMALQRGDYPVAERLARLVLDEYPSSVAAGLILGRALAFSGRGAEAEAVLARTEGASPGERSAVAAALAHVQGFLLGRLDQAGDTLARAAAVVESSDRWRLDADRALVGAMAGRFDTTIDAATAVIGSSEASEVSKATAHVNLALALSMTGRVEEAELVAERGDHLAVRHAEELPLAGLQLFLTRATSLASLGQIELVVTRCRERLAASLQAGVPDPMTSAWLGLALGMRGRFDEAIEHQQAALNEFEEADSFRLLPQSIGILTTHCGQGGLLGGGAAAQLHAASEAAGGETRLTVWIGRGRTWLLAASGDLEAAAASALEVGSGAVERDHVTWGIWALHDAVRIGAWRDVMDVLERAEARTTRPPLLRAMTDHARALRDAAPDVLLSVATRFERCGSPLLAAECAMQAAELHDASGGDLPARRAAARGQLLLRSCQRVATPAVMRGPAALSERQLDVVELAVDGASSRAIADRLFLSTRTVDNHLSAVYRAVGVESRQELAGLLVPEREG